MRVLILLALALGGCIFSPSIGDGRVHCSAQGECPPGFACGSDGLCWSPGKGPDFGAPACGTLHCFVGWCGPISDSCGDLIDCGSCNPGNPVSSKDMAGCTPTVGCSPDVCGTADDGCGGKIGCIDCPTPGTCSSTTPNRCTCVPKTCAGVVATCGQYPDGCGRVLDCWPAGMTSCGPGKSNGSCGGGGPYTCGKHGSCTPLGACPLGACADIPDGCTTVLHCGACPTGQICGANGQANRCG